MIKMTVSVCVHVIISRARVIFKYYTATNICMEIQACNLYIADCTTPCDSNIKWYTNIQSKAVNLLVQVPVYGIILCIYGIHIQPRLYELVVFLPPSCWLLWLWNTDLFVTRWWGEQLCVWFFLPHFGKPKQKRKQKKTQKRFRSG